MRFNIYKNPVIPNIPSAGLLPPMIDECDFFIAGETEFKENSIYVCSLAQIEHIELYLTDAQIQTFAAGTNNNLVVADDRDIKISVAVRELTRLVEKHNLNPAKIFFMTMSKRQASELNTALLDTPIYGINITNHNIWLLRVANRKYTYTYPNQIEKKFSVFSRRYDRWRLQFFLDLIQQNLLDNCRYTFSNSHPDASFIEFHADNQISQEEMKSLVTGPLESCREKVFKWIEGVPYQMGDWLDDAFSTDVDTALQKASIHIVLESRILEKGDLVNLTEKVWKPVLSKKTFLVYGQVGILSLFRKEGFKTFSPWINEEYDLIEDTDERGAAILKEMSRLNKLSKKELEQVIEKCLPILKHNYQELQRFKNQALPTNFQALGIFK